MTQFNIQKSIYRDSCSILCEESEPYSSKVLRRNIHKNNFARLLQLHIVGVVTWVTSWFRNSD